MVAALYVLATSETEAVKPLAGRSLLVSVLVIIVVMAAVILAGLGYFSPSKGKNKS